MMRVKEIMDMLHIYIEQEGNARPSSVGADEPLEESLSEPAAVYPASDDARLGVRTDEGTDPVDTDQGDEQNEAKIFGTPDDISSDAYGDETADESIERPYIK